MTSAPDWEALREAFGVKQPKIEGFTFTVRDLMQGADIKTTAVRNRLRAAVDAGRVVQVRPARGHIDAVYALAKGVTPAMVGELFVEAPKPNGRKRTRRLYPRHAADGVGRARDVRG